jgi:Tol biopolymer transport system component
VTVTAPPRPPRRPSDPVTHGELDALVEALMEEARRRGRRRRRRNGAIVTLVALVAVAGFAIVGRGTESDSASPALAARSSAAGGKTESKIAFIREPEGGYAGVLWVMNPDGSGQRRLAPAHPSMRWSPDGQKLVFDNLYVMYADGSGRRKLTPDNGREPVWSPDGRRIAYLSNGNGVRVVNADGSGLRRLTRDGGNGSAPAWSPDGQQIAFVRRRDSGFELYAMSADGSGQRRLTRNAWRDSDPVWSPDGRQIAFVSNWQVWVMNAGGGGQRRLTHNGARNFAPRWSPDGQRIAFERRVGRVNYGRCNGCGRAAKFEVWVMNADGSKARMLAQEGAEPVWSPEGRKLAFTKILRRDARSGRPLESDIYVMNADGSGQRNLTRTPGAASHESVPVWSPAQK